MTILVTGASGTIGRHLIDELRRHNSPVRAFVHDRERARAALGDGVDLAVGDLAARDTLTAAMAGVDQVFVSTPNHPHQVDWEIAVIDAAVAAGVRRAVKLSALGAEIGSPLAFWDAHGRLETHLRDAAVHSVVLRPTFYMTNVLMSATSIRDAGAMFLPAAGAKIAMVDPRDVASAATAVLVDRRDETATTYDVTGPEAVTFDDVAATLSELTGRPIDFVPVPDDAARQQLVEAGTPEWFATNLVTLFGLLRAGAGSSISDGVQALTGREPTSLASFAGDHVEAFS